MLLPWLFPFTIPRFGRAVPFSAMGILWYRYIDEQTVISKMMTTYHLLTINGSGKFSGMQNSIDHAPKPWKPESIPFIISHFTKLESQLTDYITKSHIWNAMQLARKEPHDLVQNGILLNDAKRIYRFVKEYINKSNRDIFTTFPKFS